MSEHGYKIRNQFAMHFVTFQVWSVFKADFIENFVIDEAYNDPNLQTKDSRAGSLPRLWKVGNVLFTNSVSEKEIKKLVTAF